MPRPYDGLFMDTRSVHQRAVGTGVVGPLLGCAANPFEAGHPAVLHVSAGG